jgi:hypothetical protein
LVVHHQGVRQSLDKALARVTNTQSQSIYELIRLISSTKLAPFWNEQFPNYPAFTRLSQPVTEASRKSNASEALRLIGGQGGTALGRGVLAGLGLLDEEDTIRPHLSPYAQQYLELLKSKGAGKVVNRNDVIEMVADSIDHPIERDRLFQIEPEWVAVILAALTYAGDIVITVDRNEMIDASSIDKLVMKPVDSITRFQHFGAPKDVPIGIWEQIFEHFGLASGTIRDSSPAAREAAVKALQIEVSKRQSYLIELQTRISQGFNLWNEPVFTDNFHLVTERGAIVGSDHPEVPLLSTKLLVDIRAYVKHLSELAKVNTVGKLRNLSLNSADVYEMKQQSKTVERAQRLIQLVTEFQPQVAYLAEAQAILPADHSWIIEAESAKRELLANIRYFGGGQVETSAVTTLSGSLADLKRRYTEIYTELHTAARLSKSDDDRKAKLASDARLITLKELAKIDLFSKSQGELTAWSTATGGLKTCTSFYPELLEHSPKCEHCKFVPAQESSTNPAGVRLKTLDNRLDDLFASWHNVLRTALNSETATTSLCNMTAAERAPIELFLKQQPDEPSLPPSFIKSATGALEGISSVAISEEALVAALRAGGLPATPADLRMRFESLLSELLKGHDSKSTRIGIQATIGSNQS